MGQRTSAIVPASVSARQRAIVERLEDVDAETARELALALFELNHRTRWMSAGFATLAGALGAAAVVVMGAPLLAAFGAMGGAALGVVPYRAHFLELCDSLGIARPVAKKLFVRWLKFNGTPVQREPELWVERCTIQLLGL
jgi:hypothetical protein